MVLNNFTCSYRDVASDLRPNLNRQCTEHLLILAGTAFVRTVGWTCAVKFGKIESCILRKYSKDVEPEIFGSHTGAV